MGSRSYLVTQTTTTNTMEKFNSEEFKQNSQTSEKGYSIMQAILGGVMVAVGYNYYWPHHNGGNVDGVLTEEDNLCPNGAAYWLWIAGILLLVSNSINGWAKMYKKCAERDGKIDCGEKVGMAINSFSSGVMGIVDFAMLIWGSVVVFGAYSTWVSDWDTYKKEPENHNFCEYTPMMTAFVILILKWVLIPVMIAITCFCACCCACCCGMFGAASNQQNQS